MYLLSPKEKQWRKEKFRIPEVLVSRKKMNKKSISEFLKHFLKLFRKQNLSICQLNVNSNVSQFSTVHTIITEVAIFYYNCIKKLYLYIKIAILLFMSSGEIF